LVAFEVDPELAVGVVVTVVSLLTVGLDTELAPAALIAVELAPASVVSCAKAGLLARATALTPAKAKVRKIVAFITPSSL
jgi:hypothetical protein